MDFHFDFLHMNRIYKYSQFIPNGQWANAKTYVQYINFGFKKKQNRKNKQEPRIEQTADEIGALTQ